MSKYRDLSESVLGYINVASINASINVPLIYQFNIEGNVYVAACRQDEMQ